MFHRVKSEGQDDEQQTESASQSQTASAASSQNNNPATSQASQGQTTQATPETQDQKDETPMTEPEKTPQEPTPATTYQRAPQAAVRTGGYPGAYPGAAATASTSSEASASDRRLTIGPGITMSGEIESCDYLLVEGTVEAALKGANVLEIAEAGVFYGTVEINEANIAGRFEGDITVNGRLTISSGGAVTGSISYKEIEIEAGATVDGKLTPLAAAPATAAKKPAQKAQAKPAAKSEKAPEPANSDGELFSKATAAAE